MEYEFPLVRTHCVLSVWLQHVKQCVEVNNMGGVHWLSMSSLGSKQGAYLCRLHHLENSRTLTVLVQIDLII